MSHVSSSSVPFQQTNWLLLLPRCLPLMASCWDLESMVWLLQQHNDILAKIKTLQGAHTQHMAYLVHVRLTHNYNCKLSAFHYSKRLQILWDLQ